MEVATAPLSSVFTSMTVKDSEEALSANSGKVNHEGVSVLHGSARALVLGNTDLIRRVLSRMAV
jgi:hypothetical protein